MGVAAIGDPAQRQATYILLNSKYINFRGISSKNGSPKVATPTSFLAYFNISHLNSYSVLKFNQKTVEKKLNKRYNLYIIVIQEMKNKNDDTDK